MIIAHNDNRVNLFDAMKARKPVVNFVSPLKTIEDGKAWIEALFAAEMLFHFEDGPENVGNMVGGEWVNLFTPTQAKLARRRVDELYAMDWATVGHECPIGYALEVMERAIA